ncbi:pentatricopeptide repeat-containing protein [Dorcoceras hygrometricum]|uniref:Pentatricopeptide repeat-containing protein n=1 Tax=Dorcoceras hygrometricum TaxID=472368 RepID=A0A2Z6ZVH6_9LAMI|nr:pentatricopeptide repeat-containing protein [Dorcoceras hygrometricum]
MLNKKLTTANVTVKNDGNQQMVRVQQMKRDQLCKEKAGSAMMTSAVMSSQPAGSLYIQTQERSDVVEEEIQSQATVHQQLVLGDSDSKTMSFT